MTSSITSTAWGISFSATGHVATQASFALLEMVHAHAAPSNIKVSFFPLLLVLLIQQKLIHVRLFSCLSRSPFVKGGFGRLCRLSCY
jgi:hypothetical protein